MLCAVINPPLLTTNTLVLSDCQLVQLDVTSRVFPLVNRPIAVTCDVAPAFVNDEKFSEKEKTTPSIVGETGVGVDAAVGEDEPQEPRPTARRTTGRSLRVSLSRGHFPRRSWQIVWRADPRTSPDVRLFTYAPVTYRRNTPECPVWAQGEQSLGERVVRRGTVPGCEFAGLIMAGPSHRADGGRYGTSIAQRQARHSDQHHCFRCWVLCVSLDMTRGLDVAVGN